MSFIYVLLNVLLFYVIAVFVVFSILNTSKIDSINSIILIWILESIGFGILTTIPVYKLVFPHSYDMVILTFILFSFSHFIVNIILSDVYSYMNSSNKFSKSSVIIVYHISHVLNLFIMLYLII